MAITLIDEATAAGARCHKACALLGISARTLRRWRARGELSDKRRGAQRHCPHALSPLERQRIIATCNSALYKDLPPSQIVPRLADAGIYIASESSFYRTLKAHAQDARRGRARAPHRPARPTPVAATTANLVWSWDITYLPTAVRGQFLRLYMIMDVYSRLITGWEVHHEEAAEHASTLIYKACLRHGVQRHRLVLHSDNGSPMKAATMLATLQRLGVLPSFSRPAVSNDNAYSEALFRTVKFTPAWPEAPFADIDAARRWAARFVHWYNTEHRHSGIQFVTPAQRHDGQHVQILSRRHELYEAARAAHPLRWRGRATRDWTPTATVWLNPTNDTNTPPTMQTLAA